MTGRIVPAWAVTVSVFLHAALFAALIYMPRITASDKKHTLRTVRFRMAPALKLKPPAAKEPVEKPAVKAVVPEPKVDDKVKPSPVAKPAPIQQTGGKKIPPPKPVAERPSASAGAVPEASVAGTSVASFDGVVFPFDYYIQQFLNRISANWYRPDIRGDRSVTVHFMIKRNGRIHDCVIEETSGISAFDRAALRAIYASNPLPPLPDGFSEDSLGIHLKFE